MTSAAYVVVRVEKTPHERPQSICPARRVAKLKAKKLKKMKAPRASKAPIMVFRYPKYSVSMPFANRPTIEPAVDPLLRDDCHLRGI